MAECYIGEIRLFAFGFAPDQWHVCDGSLLQILQNQALYALLGTQFGGDGTKTFGLPDLRGRTPVHYYTTIDTTRITTGNVGAKAGSDTVTLAANQAPDHLHQASASSDAATKPRAATSAQQNVPATTQPISPNPTALPIYVAPGAATTLQALAPATLTPISAAVPHENRQPFLAANYCIALTGYYPIRP